MSIGDKGGADVRQSRNAERASTPPYFLPPVEGNWCRHDRVEPDPADVDFGICQDCGATGFPLTDEDPAVVDFDGAVSRLVEAAERLAQAMDETPPYDPHEPRKGWRPERGWKRRHWGKR